MKAWNKWSPYLCQMDGRLQRVKAAPPCLVSAGEAAGRERQQTAAAFPSCHHLGREGEAADSAEGSPAVAGPLPLPFHRLGWAGRRRQGVFCLLKMLPHLINDQSSVMMAKNCLHMKTKTYVLAQCRGLQTMGLGPNLICHSCLFSPYLAGGPQRLQYLLSGLF